MTNDDLLDAEVTPHHQQLAARLALACVDLDADRLDAALTEVAAGGLDCALPVCAFLSRNTAAVLVARFGLDTARTILEKSITDADGVSDDRQLQETEEA
jgi:hypothetical protein